MARRMLVHVLVVVGTASMIWRHDTFGLALMVAGALAGAALAYLLHGR